MKYVLMIYETPGAFEARSGKDQAAFWGAWRAYAEALKDAGVMTGGSGLEPPAAGTTVRFEKGESTIEDGPYAETKEQLGGFFIIDVPDDQAALAWAKRCPVGTGAVEVRPALTGSLTQRPS